MISGSSDRQGHRAVRMLGVDQRSHLPLQIAPGTWADSDDSGTFDGGKRLPWLVCSQEGAADAFADKLTSAWQSDMGGFLDARLVTMGAQFLNSTTFRYGYRFSERQG